MPYMAIFFSGLMFIHMIITMASVPHYGILFLLLSFCKGFNYRWMRDGPLVYSVKGSIPNEGNPAE